MSAIRRLLPYALAVAALALTSPVQAARVARDHETWITIERSVAEKAQAAYAATGRDPLVLEGDGNVVVAQIRESDVPFLSEVLHKQLHHCGGFMGHSSRDAAFDEAFRANRPDSERLTSGPPSGYTIDNGPVAQALVANVQEINVRNNIITLSNFFTRYHNCPSGAQSATAIRDQWLALANGRPDVTAQLFTHTGYTTLQPSVILTIQGTTLPNEVVVLGAHQDSIAGSNCSTSRAPGADDDGSGIASITEVLRAAMALGYHPQRTVKFMGYAAEEIGLRGSAQIAASFANANPRVNVVGVLHFDMTNYTTSSSDIYLINDNTNAAQNAFVASLVDTYLPGITRSTTVCQYKCSDHASWNDQGYPASLPFEAYFQPPPPSSGDNPFIHSSQDTIQQSGNTANHAIKFTRLGAAYLAEAAKGGFNNQAPLAAAGPDQLVRSISVVTLDGRGSSDPEGAPLTYSWTQISGPSVVINGANTSVAHFRPRPLDAVYVLRLTVSDGLAQATDDVRVTVARQDVDQALVR